MRGADLLCLQRRSEPYLRDASRESGDVNDAREPLGVPDSRPGAGPFEGGPDPNSGRAAPGPHRSQVGLSCRLRDAGIRMVDDRWPSTGPHCHPVRHLATNGTCSIVKLRDHDGQNIVMQLSGPSRSILVQAASGIAVQLPCPGSASLPILDGLAVRTRQWSWPTLNGSHKQLEVARRAGNLFHTDFCDGHSW